MVKSIGSPDSESCNSSSGHSSAKPIVLINNFKPSPRPGQEDPLTTAGSTEERKLSFNNCSVTPTPAKTTPFFTTI